MPVQHNSLQTGHIGLNVSDLDRSKRFYQEVLGLDDLGGSEDPDRPYAFLGRSGDVLLTLWAQSDGSFQPGRPGLHHLAFRVDSMDEVRAAQARLRAVGATVLHGGIVPHREGAASGGVFFEDPDGTRLEIFAPQGAEDGKAPFHDAPTCGFF
jgi:lactoylglutathione lyase